MIAVLDCKVMPYAWGSRTAIAELTGRPSPAPGPEAELWMGAHPMAPSRVAVGGASVSLSDLVERDPRGTLGDRVVDGLGPRLPFLLKVLAAAEPLSLQAHPTAEQARAGFDDEERRGVPRDAPTRNYKDPSHKPELLAALTPFDALCGFRRAEDTARLFDALGVSALAGSVRERGLGETFRAIMTGGAPPVGEVVLACEAHARAQGAFARECAWATRLAALYPGDVGVISALLLNLLHLEPGEAIYLGAGNLHAYLEGVGVEIMASSDNVLRGGLTKKHVDVPELMRVLDFADGPVTPIRARAEGDVEDVYDAPAREFRLSRLRAGGAPAWRDVVAPEILLCTEGAALVEPASGAGGATLLAKGSAAFVAAGTGRYGVRAAPGATAAIVYRATANL